VFEVTDKSGECFGGASSEAGSSQPAAPLSAAAGGGEGPARAAGFVPFGGAGSALGGAPAVRSDSRVTALAAAAGSGPFFSFPSLAPPSAAAVHSLADAPRPANAPMSAAALLAALPARSVSAGGAVSEVRAGVAAALGLRGGAGRGAAALSLPAGAPPPPQVAPEPPAGDVATLRVRLDAAAPSGTPPLVLRLRADVDTVADLFRLVAAARGSAGGSAFELRCAAPPMALAASGPAAAATLRAAGLAPTANLFVRTLS
jgi:hypothetical protein